jgi:glycosyltransferase involved in cell wall biosynthesis
VLTTDANGKTRLTQRDLISDPPFSGLNVEYHPRIMRNSVSLSLLRSLLKGIAWANIVHLTGVYSFPTMPTLLAAAMENRPIVWSPRGAFGEWKGARRQYAKRVWMKTCTVLMPKRTIFHVASPKEAEDVVTALGNVPVAIVPNGVDAPGSVERRHRGETLRLLYLGRLHPLKNIESLLEACVGLGLRWRLTIAGSGKSSYEKDLRRRVADLGLGDNVTFCGLVRGAQKAALFQNHDILVQPSLSENFGLVVAEALAHALPVICSKEAPWGDIREIGCGVWIPPTAPEIKSAILHMNTQDLTGMGMRGRGWVESAFSWKKATEQMIDVYESLLVNRTPAGAASSHRPSD